MTAQILLPNFYPRFYQLAPMRYFDEGGKRAVMVWHRRSGKDLTMLHQTSKMAHERVGAYYHMLPEFSQARKVIWDGIDSSGKKLLDQAFPLGIRSATHESEMKVSFTNGSFWQLVGSDRYDAIMGTNPVGIVFSEFSLANPSAWEYIRPILAENGGWAAFIYTPRGRNHGYSLYNQASGDPAWFCDLKTVTDTGGISPEAIEAERRAGMPDEMIEQEFHCSFTAGALGSYYGKILDESRKAGRITFVPYNPQLSTEYWFDLGWNDSTSMWVMQRAGIQINALRYMEWQTTSLPRICADIRSLGWRRDRLVLPHDGDHHELIAGRTRQDVMEDELNCLADVVKRPTNAAQKLEQIHAVRSTLPLVYFDAKGCEFGIFALESYSRKWDDKAKVFAQEPLHNFASHCADAFRTGCARETETPIIETPAGQRMFHAKHRVITAVKHGARRVDPRDDMSWMQAARELG